MNYKRHASKTCKAFNAVNNEFTIVYHGNGDGEDCDKIILFKLFRNGIDIGLFCEIVSTDGIRYMPLVADKKRRVKDWELHTEISKRLLSITEAVGFVMNLKYNADDATYAKLPPLDKYYNSLSDEDLKKQFEMCCFIIANKHDVGIPCQSVYEDDLANRAKMQQVMMNRGMNCGDPFADGKEYKRIFKSAQAKIHAQQRKAA